MSKTTYDAVVIGAGPAGATVALILARAGWSVAVIEKASFPRRKVCGEFISATSLPLLDELGLLDEFVRRAGPEVRRVGLFAHDASLAAPMPRSDHRSGTWGRALGREHLDLLVLQAAVHAGAAVWQPWQARALRRTESGYVCTISSQQDVRELASSVIIAAHVAERRTRGDRVRVKLRPNRHFALPAPERDIIMFITVTLFGSTPELLISAISW